MYPYIIGRHKPCDLRLLHYACVCVFVLQTLQARCCCFSLYLSFFSFALIAVAFAIPKTVRLCQMRINIQYTHIIVIIIIIEPPTLRHAHKMFPFECIAQFTPVCVRARALQHKHERQT